MRLSGTIITAVLFLLGSPAFTPAQTTTQPADASEAAAVPNSGVTLRTSAKLVVVDVVVTKGNKPVHGLTRGDFALAEQGVSQVIAHFEEHVALTPADATRFPAFPVMSPDTFTDYTPAPANGAVSILLLDSLNTPQKDQSYLRQQLLAYLSSAPPGARIAIFGLNSSLTLLQGFTSDPALLKAVLSTKRSKASPLLDDSVGGGGIQNSAADNLEDLNVPGTGELVANLRQFEAERQSEQLQLRAKETLEAMSLLARYLSVLPGRKNLLWFSGSFPISILPDTTASLRDPFAVIASSEDEFRATVNLLARSQVAVYPIDARGIQVSPVFDASTTRNYSRNPARFNQDEQKFSTDTDAEISTMRQMAEATGGRAFVNTNGLAQAAANAIDEGSNFYTLTYVPANADRKGKFRKIKVTLARSGYDLAYRRGYYAEDAKSPIAQPAIAGSAAAKPAAPDTVAAEAKAETARQNLHAVMARGAPTPSEILMKVGVFPAGGPAYTEAVPAPGNSMNAKIQGPFRRYSVSYAIDPGGLTLLRTAAAKITCNVELLVFVYNADGSIVNSLGTRLRLNETREELNKTLAEGVRYVQEISAPAKGEYFLRIAVHDIPGDRYGVIEVATSELKPLP